MHFSLSTSVWGNWHLRAFTDITVPTLLSPGNIPALSSTHKCEHRIYTTPGGRRYLSAHPIMKKLARYATVDYVVPTNKEILHSDYHIIWWHDTAAECARMEKIMVVVPPDIAWTDGAFGYLGPAMSREGLRAVSCPHIRVVSETAMPEMIDQYSTGPGCEMIISPSDIVRLGMRHMHPLSAATIWGMPYCRPTLEAIWTVPGQGFLVRQFVRELFAIDTRRVSLSECFYGRELTSIDELDVGADTNDLFMLSLTPLMKDAGHYYPKGHPLNEVDLASTSLHPLNKTPLNWEIIRQPVRMSLGAPHPKIWSSVERRSLVKSWRAILARECQLIWGALHEQKCRKAAQLLSLAIQDTPFLARWRGRGPVTILVPADSALSRETAVDLAKAGNEAALIKTLANHVLMGVHDLPAAGAMQGTTMRSIGGKILKIQDVAGKTRINDRANILGSTSVEGHKIYVIDAPLFEDPQAEVSPKRS